MALSDDQELQLIARGQHADPHRVLGRHGDVVRAYRPDAAAMRLITGPAVQVKVHGHDPGASGRHLRRADRQGRPPLPAGGGLPARRTGAHLSLSTIRTGRGPRSVNSTCISSAKAGIAACGRCSAPTPGSTTAWPACPLPCGRRTPGPCGWSGTGTTGTAAFTPCGLLGSSGVWELFIPGVAAGARYKYELVTAAGRLILKTDPMAFALEPPPGTASVVVPDAGPRVEGRRLAGGPGRARILLRRPAGGLRGPPRVVAPPPRTPTADPAAHLPGAGRAASGLCGRHGVYPRRDDAGRRTPLHADRGAIRSPATTRRRRALGRPTTSGPSWTPCTSGGSG